MKPVSTIRPPTSDEAAAPPDSEFGPEVAAPPDSEFGPEQPAVATQSTSWIDKVPGLRRIVGDMQRTKPGAVLGELAGGVLGARLGGVPGTMVGVGLGNLAGQGAEKLADKLGAPSHSAATTYGKDWVPDEWSPDHSNDMDYENAAVDSGVAGLTAAIMRGGGWAASKLGAPKIGAALGYGKNAADAVIKGMPSDAAGVVTKGIPASTAQELDQQLPGAIKQRAQALGVRAGENAQIQTEMEKRAVTPLLQARDQFAATKATDSRGLLRAVEGAIPQPPPTGFQPSLGDVAERTAGDTLAARQAADAELGRVAGTPSSPLDTLAPDPRSIGDRAVGIHRQGVSQLSREQAQIAAERAAKVGQAFRNPGAVPETAGSASVRSAEEAVKQGDVIDKTLGDAVNENQSFASKALARGLPSAGRDATSYTDEQAGLEALSGAGRSGAHVGVPIPGTHARAYLTPGAGGYSPTRLSQIVGAVLKNQGIESQNPVVREALRDVPGQAVAAPALNQLLRDFLARQKGAAK